MTESGQIEHRNSVETMVAICGLSPWEKSSILNPFVIKYLLRGSTETPPDSWLFDSKCTILLDKIGLYSD